MALKRPCCRSQSQVALLRPLTHGCCRYLATHDVSEVVMTVLVTYHEHRPDLDVNWLAALTEAAKQCKKVSTRCDAWCCTGSSVAKDDAHGSIPHSPCMLLLSALAMP